MPTVIKAARDARAFLRQAKDAGGAYRLDHWPTPRPARRPAARRLVRRPAARRPAAGRPAPARRLVRTNRDARTAVARLRVVQRLTAGFLDPVDDAVFLTAGLRALGHPASFHLGRELAPAKPPAGYFPWVQCGDEVVSTSLPVLEEYIEIHRAEAP
ncbi:lasso peptide biosynthesis protein [Actinomadura rubrisoli]|uniref:Microcin J25-processing protein McjB C-terminal domain-containing protein n=1 Tax=Actinomadura rubrisoli TaxID=2530368 RepID=A0A4R5ALI4_9ACTN|nr:lasso peptide biosynthesis protein [Actinomadura rubrisoli]TDD72480.1 hypothetical protein E1298_35030 [Actinomadura rubrisoli]